MARTTHWLPKTSASSETSSGRATAAEFTETLSAPASSTACASSAERTPPPIVNGMNTSSAVRRASSTTVSRFSCEAVMSRNTIPSAPSSWYRRAGPTRSRQPPAQLRVIAVRGEEGPQRAHHLLVQLAGWVHRPRRRPVEVLHQHPAPRPRGAHHRAEHAAALRQVLEHEPGVYEVEAAGE